MLHRTEYCVVTCLHVTRILCVSNMYQIIADVYFKRENFVLNSTAGDDLCASHRGPSGPL